MRVGLMGHNSVEIIDLLIDIWNRNDSAVLIDYDMPTEALDHLVENSKVAFLYIEDSLLKRIDISKISETEIKSFSISAPMPCCLPESVREKYRSRYDENEAVVIFSSGTTGLNKGISLSHRAISNNADSIIDYMHPTEADCLYLNKKLSHSSSLTGELLVALKSNAKILISQIVVPPRIAFRNIREFSVSVLCCNPMLLKLYTDYCEGGTVPPSIRVIYTSGDMISRKEIDRTRRGFNCPVYNVYGQTECGPRITAQTKEYCHNNSVGRPIKNVEVAIGEDNEILVRTNSLFSGYTNAENTFGEWHKTGDAGFIDDNGELFVFGRMDNMIVINAHNVFPETVESVILENTEVDECLVYAEDGMLVCEFVSQTENHITITRKIRAQLMPYEIPTVYRKTDAILKTRTGKKLRTRK